VGDDFVHESIIGSLFDGRVEAAARVGNHDAIVPSILRLGAPARRQHHPGRRPRPLPTDSRWPEQTLEERELTSQGETIEEALANMREATDLYLEEFPLRDVGRPIITTFELL